MKIKLIALTRKKIFRNFCFSFNNNNYNNTPDNSNNSNNSNNPDNYLIETYHKIKKSNLSDLVIFAKENEYFFSKNKFLQLDLVNEIYLLQEKDFTCNTRNTAILDCTSCEDNHDKNVNLDTFFYLSENNLTTENYIKNIIKYAAFFTSNLRKNSNSKQFSKGISLLYFLVLSLPKIKNAIDNKFKLELETNLGIIANMIDNVYEYTYLSPEKRKIYYYLLNKILLYLGVINTNLKNKSIESLTNNEGINSMRMNKNKNTISKQHKNLMSLLLANNIKFEVEKEILYYDVDIFFNNKIIEVNGEDHFFLNINIEKSKYILKRESLTAKGYKYYDVNYFNKNWEKEVLDFTKI